MARFTVAEEVRVAGSKVDLGPNFDGDALDVSSLHAVSTISSFGGSRVVFVELETGTVSTSGFPEPEGNLANPSQPAFDESGAVWVGGRGSDAVYRVTPGEAVATRIGEAVGTFVERVVPIGDELWAVDANIDDEGFTFQPLGPSRVVVLARSGEVRRIIELPAGAPNARDAVLSAGRLVVLAGGTFDPVTFAPDGNGAIVTIDVADESLSVPVPLDGNGIGLESGRDGLIYVTSTTDFVTIDLLRFDPATGAFQRGPDNPIRIRDAAGSRVDCWTATALADRRLLCATFSFAEAGRLLLLDSEGRALSEVPSGFGTTDIRLLE
jgi:hypothetical protein